MTNPRSILKANWPWSPLSLETWGICAHHGCDLAWVKESTMRNVNFGMEEVGQSYWTYKQRSAGDPGSGPLYPVLNWILEQLNLDNFKVDIDEHKEVVGIILGRDAIPKFSSEDAAIEHARIRFRAVEYAGLFAKAREEGVEPQFGGLAKHVTFNAKEGAYTNTELHYAHELVKVLGRIRKKTFILSAPPI